MKSSKKELKRKIEELESALAYYKNQKKISAVIEEEGLPKCEGSYCYQCAYAVYKPVAYGMHTILLGCGRNAKCESFTPVYDKTKIELCSSFQKEKR